MALSRVLASVRRELARLPQPFYSAVVSAVAFWVLGGIVGLVVGLYAYPPTAWAAVIEVGAPAGLVGGVLGLLFGILLIAVRRLRRR